VCAITASQFGTVTTEWFEYPEDCCFFRLKNGLLFHCPARVDGIIEDSEGWEVRFHHVDAERAALYRIIGRWLERQAAAPAADPTPGEDPIFGKVIYSYTRAEAIADGTLIDLGTFSFRAGLTVLQEVGIKFPVAITRAAYARTIQEDGAELPPCQDLSGRTFDVVNMLSWAIRRSAGGSEIRYRVHVVN
jgi:hypothetical protein